MRLSFAAYDPALRSPNGNYWAWRSSEITVAIADEARALIARHHHCDAPNSLGPDDLHGGCLGLSSMWLVFYRYFNGGRDLTGRPERSILLLAFADRTVATQSDCSMLLDMPPFSEWAKRQPLSGCPEMPTTSNVLVPPMPLASQSLLPEDWSTQFGQLQKLSARHNPAELWQAACQLFNDARFLLRNQRTSGESQSNLSVLAGPTIPHPPVTRTLVATTRTAQRSPEDSQTASGFFDLLPRLHFPNLLIVAALGTVMGLAILSLVIWNHSSDGIGRGGITDGSYDSRKAQHGGRRHRQADEEELPDASTPRSAQAPSEHQRDSSKEATDALPDSPPPTRPDLPAEETGSREPLGPMWPAPATRSHNIRFSGIEIGRRGCGDVEARIASETLVVDGRQE